MAKKSRKQKRSRMRRSRRHGGMAPIMGAPLRGEDLAGGYSSQMSLGHGRDFFKYHQAQHGGQAPLSVMGGDLLPKGLEQAAGTAPLSAAFSEIAGMRDQTGGRRKSRRSKSRRSKSKSKSRGGRRLKSKSKSRRSKSKSRRSKSKSRRGKSRRHRGGASLSFAPFPSQGMILDSGLVDKAGLNPGWRGGVEFDAAANRQAL